MQSRMLPGLSYGGRSLAAQRGEFVRADHGTIVPPAPPAPEGPLRRTPDGWVIVSNGTKTYFRGVGSKRRALAALRGGR
jgi:hypothetical protein